MPRVSTIGFKRFLVPTLLSWQALAPAAAQDKTEQLGEISIEQLMDLRVENVYSASKYQQKVTQAPASVTIVTADEIRRFGHRTLADVLRSVRGLYVTYDRNYSNFGIRGFGRPGDFNTRILLMVDGHRMNDNLYDSALMGTEAILDVDLIERVEVIRGPGASIYGNNAFFGVINVITRKGARIDGLEASAEGGSLDSYKGRMTYGKQFISGLEVALSGSGFDTRGNDRLYYPEFDDAASNNGVAENIDREDSRNLYGSVAYQGLTLSAAYSQRNKQVPTASFFTHFNDGRERTTDERFYVDLSYARNVLINTQLSGRVYYDYYAYRADYPYNWAGPGDPPFVVVSHDDNYGDGIGGEIQLTRKLLDAHTLVLGAEFRESLHLLQSSYTDDPKTYSFWDNRHATSYGLYAQDEFSIRRNLALSAGLRYDHAGNFGGELSPRLGLIYNPWERTTAKLLFGQAFRAPNAYEAYVESPGFSKPNPELRPEQIRTYELVLEQYLVEQVNLTASAYRYEVRDLISSERDPADGLQIFENRDRVTGEGLEFGVNARSEQGWSASASLALQRARDEETGEQLNNSPQRLAKANVGAPLWTDRLLAGLELQYASPSRTLSGQESSSFMIANATISGPQVLKNFDLSASVYNLFDRDYAYPGSTGHVQNEIPQDGRSFRLKATYRF